MQNVNSSDFAVKVGILAPLVMQGLALLGLVLLEALYDGHLDPAVVGALISMISIGGLSSGGATLMHLARSPAPAASGVVTVPNQTAQAVGLIPSTSGSSGN